MAVKKTELYAILWEAANNLRGGVEPARYKDYVLTLLFFKYVSDRYKGERYGDYSVREGASFEDLVAAKGKTDIGERVDKILSAFLEENQLQGSLPDVSFNNEDELGHGKELVDRVTKLIAVFENPAIDFRTNRASGDDIIGDAYEYFMMKFAQESGKSKGQFYTPSEVSRIMARLIGIANIDASRKTSWTLYDPACGSGSLLIRAADEAPVNRQGNSVVTIYGQEVDKSTAGLARMNLVLHQKGTGEIKTQSTLSSPQFKDSFDQLRKFDFIVMNPPFSDKEWTNGINPDNDIYHRFDGYGTPPAKNGDWAWFLHVLKSLDSAGKAATIMPHGVLFRGNSEETIRKQVLANRYITGIVSLPANLFYGTGIPACIIVIDKERTEEHDGIFMIDASQGFKKDGNKNRLREQDIERIVHTFTNKLDVPGYSRMVSYEEILENNGGNLNVPRYIQRPATELPQDIAAHLQGGIPAKDIESLGSLWEVAPALKNQLFNRQDSGRFELLLSPDALASHIATDPGLEAQKQKETAAWFDAWAQSTARPVLLDIDKETDLKAMIRAIGQQLVRDYSDARMLDAYDVFDVLLNYWNERLQDDAYLIKAVGYLAGREIEYIYQEKKNADGEKIKTSKVTGFDGVLLPKELIEVEYFATERSRLSDLEQQIAASEAELDQILEEQPEEDNPFDSVLSSSGSVTKAALKSRIAELEAMKSTPELTVVAELLEALASKNTIRIAWLLEQNPDVAALDLYGKNGKLIKRNTVAVQQQLLAEAPIPELYREEYEALTAYQAVLEHLTRLKTQAKEARKDLDALVKEQYGELSEDEIKHLLFEKKWCAALSMRIVALFAQRLHEYTTRITEIAKRYERTLPAIEADVQRSRDTVLRSLERMGYSW
ncbi:MAG: N-6 DNA methylase [Bifidobacterium tsurumiense]|uniref:N-6 DNA methylase n=1 Tax=Bifidobacterium tsurumiense TaxID=356829 RepID=UPI002A807BF4|nr:N-6 DNA methylase [Bifidobacterium tsurumiense]MDY4677803.1 N-6 DNA methylase [Bifidobacterium tsurumiense]